MAGPTVEFTVSTFIALGGADFKATLNDQPVDPNRCYQVLSLIHIYLLELSDVFVPPVEFGVTLGR